MSSCADRQLATVTVGDEASAVVEALAERARTDPAVGRLLRSVDPAV